MDNKDLEYLLKYNPHKVQNIYKPGITTSTAGLHFDALKNSNFKYRVKSTNRKYLKQIDLLRIDGSLIGSVLNPYYPTTTKLAREITNDKLKTEKLLNFFGINTPRSRVYNPGNVDMAFNETFKNNHNNVVIKPLASSFGRGVRVNVSEDRFKYNWDLAVKDIKESDKRIVVQAYLKGFEARVTIIEGAVESVVVRVPPNIKGDGKHSISELIDIKNEERKQCSYLTKMPIVKSERIREFLLSHKLSFESVPTDGQAILLNSVSNVAQGGELIDITDVVSKSIKEAALNALAAVPGVRTGGLDVIMTSFEDKNPVILEINTFPVLSIPTYPTYGIKKSPAKSYFESVYAIDQYKNNPVYQYIITKQNNYVRDYIQFIERRENLIKANYDIFTENIVD